MSLTLHIYNQMNKCYTSKFFYIQDGILEWHCFYTKT